MARSNRSGLLSIDPFQKLGVNRSAVTVHSVAVNSDCFCQLAFMGRHDVHEVSDGLRCVSLPADMNMNSRHSGVITFHSGFPQCSYNPLQKFHVLVMKNGADHFTFLAFRAGNADILLKLPLPALRIPRTPRIVAVASCSVFVAVGLKIPCRRSGSFLSRDIVTLDFNTECRLLHGFNLLSCFIIHGMFSFGFLPFRCVYITVRNGLIQGHKRTYSRQIYSRKIVYISAIYPLDNVHLKS